VATFYEKFFQFLFKLVVIFDLFYASRELAVKVNSLHIVETSLLSLTANTSILWPSVFTQTNKQTGATSFLLPYFTLPLVMFSFVWYSFQHVEIYSPYHRPYKRTHLLLLCNFQSTLYTCFYHLDCQCFLCFIFRQDNWDDAGLCLLFSICYIQTYLGLQGLGHEQVVPRNATGSFYPHKFSGLEKKL
jgi:hypothetical protein